MVYPLYPRYSYSKYSLSLCLYSNKCVRSGSTGFRSFFHWLGKPRPRRMSLSLHTHNTRRRTYPLLKKTGSYTPTPTEESRLIQTQPKTSYLSVNDSYQRNFFFLTIRLFVPTHREICSHLSFWFSNIYRSSLSRKSRRSHKLHSTNPRPSCPSTPSV